MAVTEALRIEAPLRERFDEVLTDEALGFVTDLHRTFNPRREKLLAQRPQRRERILNDPSFLAKTRNLREEEWTVDPVPETLQRRRTEITGPTDRKMMINALNSDADVFMADLEDANSPTWANMIQGQVNLKDATRNELTFTKEDGTRYSVEDDPATLFVRPRGLHLDEPHITIDGTPLAGAILDAGLHLFHNAERLIEQQGGPFFYIPKLEGHEEAQLWADIFDTAEQRLGLEHGTIKATALLETLPAAFEMNEILYALRHHSAGLNAGRWDYIFSLIKTFRDDPQAVLPDRSQVTMTTPFMRAYTDLLVHTCHKRGAHAMGGMAAFIPSKDPGVNEEAFQKIKEDKQREAEDGFDGTWIAHPALVDIAREPFGDILGDTPHQIDKKRRDVETQPEDLLPTRSPDEMPAFGTITEDGLRQNIGVGILYTESWLRGRGAAAIYNLMEDTATAEISRSQIWQWVTHDARLEDGRPITPALVEEIEADELDNIKDVIGEERIQEGRFGEARELFRDVALSDAFVDFLTLPGQARLEVNA